MKIWMWVVLTLLWLVLIWRFYCNYRSNTQTPFGRFFFLLSFVFVSIQRNSTGCSPFHLYSFRSAEQRGNIYTTTTTTKTSYISQYKFKEKRFSSFFFLTLGVFIFLPFEISENRKIKIGVLLARPSQGSLCSCCTIF